MATAPAPSVPAATEPVPTVLQAAPVPHTPLPNGLPAEQQSPPLLQRRQRPRVTVSYARLPPKSKARLEESLVAWAAWHAAAFGDVGADDAYADAGLVVNLSQVISETRSSSIGQAPSLINVALQAAVSSDCALACRSGCQSRARVILAAGPQWHFATRNTVENISLCRRRRRWRSAAAGCSLSRWRWQRRARNPALPPAMPGWTFRREARWTLRRRRPGKPSSTWPTSRCCIVATVALTGNSANSRGFGGTSAG